MKINNISIISSDALDFELDTKAAITLFCGRRSALALDLIREVLGDRRFTSDPDAVCDGRFVIHSDMEIDGKNYSVCYIRNADFMGDNRIGVNFTPNSIDYSLSDTEEFLKKREAELCKVAYGLADLDSSDNGLPIFLYCRDASEVDEAVARLSSFGGQAFIAIESVNAPTCADRVNFISVD